MRERVAEAIKSIVEFYRDDNEENPTYKRAHIDQMIEGNNQPQNGTL
ncbi:hypothetical protein QF03_002234 [Salmonella enterica subsp. enterica]|nr:hypothetical protein [Salmonella enterica]EDV0999441.1 hypothetical protein [Salmonella enterica subsp. enterica]EDX5648842.1 hypothetical protein [Salmonella enterica subsp. enterica serovar Kisarawe]EED3189392.1 hypothetical protein [Salmonella enterica subsp. enterica]EEK6081589.1 hypothetical protein [Salmonella enterica]EEK9013577.1 hypothetical protein [Salmonella enterica]